jgi:penicillin-binding protein 2
MQLATAFSVIATDGKLCQPRLAASAESVDGRVVERFDPVCRQVPAYTKGWFRYVRQGLEGVPRQGTAQGAYAGFPFNSLDYFGGKTGTAEVAGKQDSSWFGAIAKGKDKEGKEHEYVIVAMVEEGGHGSETAAPLVRDIVEGLFGLPGAGNIEVNRDTVGD